MNRCRTCKHWRDAEYGDYAHPIDPDTYEEMEIDFGVRECANPKLMFCERPLERNGFAVADGSNYMANLYTAEDFGCVLHEPREDAQA